MNKIGFVRIGNATFMRFSFLERKPFDLLIPLMKGQGRIYKVEFDKLDNLPAVSSKFYKFALDSSNWMEPKKQNIFDKLNSFQVVDHFGNMDDEDRTIRPDIAQASMDIIMKHLLKCLKVMIRLNMKSGGHRSPLYSL